MKLWQTLVRRPTVSSSLSGQNSILSSNGKRVSLSGSKGLRFSLNCACANSGPALSSSSSSSSAANHSSPRVVSNPCFDAAAVSQNSPGEEGMEGLEALIEKVIYRCRLLAILGVFGSLIGSFLCFIKGCVFVASSFSMYLVNHRSNLILTLIEAIDVYLLGTVMLVFGMGLYELFVSNLGSEDSLPGQDPSDGPNLFGFFILKERPQWLGIKTVNELKTKLGHVIVMLLLIGLFDKSIKAAIHTPLDLLCFAASVFLSSSCLFLLSKLN